MTAGTAHLVQWLCDGMDYPGFDSWQMQDIFLSSKMCIPALGPIQLPIQWAQRVLFQNKAAGLLSSAVTSI